MARPIDKLSAEQKLNLVERLMRLHMDEKADKKPVVRFNGAVNMLACSVVNSIFDDLFKEVKEVEKILEGPKYKLFLTHVGERKIECIKRIRQATGLGLKEAKEFSEAVLPAELTPIIDERGHKFYPTEEQAFKVLRIFTDIGSTVVLQKHESD